MTGARTAKDKRAPPVPEDLLRTASLIGDLARGKQPGADYRIKQIRLAEALPGGGGQPAGLVPRLETLRDQNRAGLPPPTAEQARLVEACGPALQRIEPDWPELNPSVSFVKRPGRKLRVESFDFTTDSPPWSDEAGTVFLLNGNNDEGYVRSLAPVLQKLKHATIMLSGFGGHGTTASFPLMGRHPGKTQQTEADRFATILAEEKAKAEKRAKAKAKAKEKETVEAGEKAGAKNKERPLVILEPFATNSGENARFAGSLMAKLPAPAGSLTVVVCGTPSAACRQTFSSAKQMEVAETVLRIVSGPVADVSAYVSDADRSAILRECSTFLVYAAKAEFVPNAGDVEDAAPFIAGVTRTLRQRVSLIATFAGDIRADPGASAAFDEAQLAVLDEIAALDEKLAGRIAAGSLEPDETAMLGRVDRLFRTLMDACLAVGFEARRQEESAD